MGACLAKEKSYRNKKLTSIRLQAAADNRCVHESQVRKTLEDIFDQYDQDGNGYLERKEIIEMLRLIMKRNNQVGAVNVEEYADRMLRYGGDSHRITK